MGSKKTTTKTNQTQTSAPPTWTAPGLEEAAARVTAGMDLIPSEHYAGPMVATMDPSELAAIQAAWGATAQDATRLSGWMESLLPQIEQGMEFTTALPSTMYNLAPRQELDAVINASIDPVRRQLMEQTLPNITSSALASGAYSGDRAMGVLPGEAIRQSDEAMQRIAAQLGYEDYQNYENRRLAAFQATTGASQQNYALETQRQAAEAADRLQRLGMAPEMVRSILHTGASAGDLLRMAAELEQSNLQLSYDNAVKTDQYASAAPFFGLDTASQLLAQLSGGWGTQTMQGKTTTTTKDPVGQIMQGAMGAAQLAMGMPPTSLFGGGGGTTMPSAAALMSSMPVPVSLPPATPYPYMTNPYLPQGW